ncbi:hypothetical protein BS78_04G240300 [Paspalum vaginatum]|nr:hypothetical protein BS78_04G240300 [Paspalum vaginatum]
MNPGRGVARHFWPQAQPPPRQGPSKEAPPRSNRPRPHRRPDSDTARRQTAVFSATTPPPAARLLLLPRPPPSPHAPGPRVAAINTSSPPSPSPSSHHAAKHKLLTRKPIAFAPHVRPSPLTTTSNWHHRGVCVAGSIGPSLWTYVRAAIWLFPPGFSDGLPSLRSLCFDLMVPGWSG